MRKTRKAGSQVQNQSNDANGYPDPAAPAAISGRLERIRTHFGVTSKRAFHRLVKDGWDDAPSYEAIRNYHYDREPPPSYLRRVLELFPDVRPRWLLLGTAPMLRSELEVAAVAAESFEWEKAVELKWGVLEAMGIPRPDPTDSRLRASVTYVPYWIGAMAEVRRTLALAGRDPHPALGEALRGPLEALEIDPRDGLDSACRLQPWLDRYITAMIPVLLSLGPQRDQQRKTPAQIEEQTDG